MAALTIADMMPWYGITLDLTGRVCGLITDDVWDFRPPDPTGRFQASIGEIAMHIADDRHDHAHMLEGSNDYSVFFTTHPDRMGIMDFKEGVTRADMLSSLAAARERLDRCAGLSAASFNRVTDGSVSTYERQMAELESRGVDVSGMRERGAPGIFRILMGCAAHEADHRGTLYTLLRMNGVSLGSEG